MSDNLNPVSKEPAQKGVDVEEGEVFSQGKSKRDDKDSAQAANGNNQKEKDKAKRDKSSDSEEAADKKSKKKKKDKSKKKDKDKKPEKKADKKEKRSHSREKKPSKRDREKSSSESRSRSKQRKRSRSKDNKRKKDESKRRSSSKPRRRSSSKQKDRKQDKHRDSRDDRDRSRDVRRKSRSPVKRGKSRERTRETETKSRREDREAPRDYTRERRKDEISKENKERKMEVVEDEPLDEETQKKIESQLAFAEEDEEAIAARAREQRKAMLEQARKAKEEEELALQQQHQAMALEEEEKQPEIVAEKVIEKKVKDKSARTKAEKFVKEAAEKTESEKTKETTREDKNVAPAEAGDSLQKMQEEETKKDEEDLSPLKKQQSNNYKHDVDKEKYIKMIESMREKLQQEEEDLRENGEAEEKEEDKNNEAQGGKKDEAQDFDMFCETPESIEAEKVAAPAVGADSSTYDDENGYYRGQIGEIVNGRYKILAKLGKGVFGNVFKGTDMQTNQDVALKVVKSEEIYLMSGLKEKEILTMLNEADRHNKRHVIRLLDSFEYRRHLLLVFELMEMDLRSAIKTFGKKLGLSIESVRSYARQLFIALAHLRKHKIIHADLKPDNILVTNNQKTLKLSDFGSAFPVEENTITPYLVARYYRAPEIILGCPYDSAVDMWSAACTIFELYTGKMLFPGRDNNEMLKLILQTKGRFNNKMVKRGEFASQYFDHQNNFLSTEIDPVTKLKYVKPIPIGGKITRDIGNLLNAVEIELSDEDRKKVVQLKDLLERCLTLDPNKRITPDEALRHTFINYTVQKITTDHNALKHAF